MIYIQFVEPYLAKTFDLLSHESLLKMFFSSNFPTGVLPYSSFPNESANKKINMVTK